MSTATELLRRAEECLRHAEYPNDYREEESDELRDDIRLYLAIEKEAEPVAWMHPNGGVIQTRLTGLERDTYTIPLYTKPSSAGKPLTEEEIWKLYCGVRSDTLKGAFYNGIRYAEKHHGISSSIPSLNDSISANSQDSGP